MLPDYYALVLFLSVLAIGTSQRIAQLEVEEAKLLDRMDQDSDESLKNHLAAVNKDLTIAYERLAKCEVQLNAPN